jgi:hypothetical protein
MKNNTAFNKDQIALFVSIGLYLIGFGLYRFISLPDAVITFIAIAWSQVEMVLIYRVAASMSHPKNK